MFSINNSSILILSLDHHQVYFPLQVAWELVQIRLLKRPES